MKLLIMYLVPVLVAFISGNVLYKAKIKTSAIYYTIPITLLFVNLMIFLFFDFSGAGEFSVIGKPLFVLFINTFYLSISYVHSYALADKKNKNLENLEQTKKRKPIIYYLAIVLIIYYVLGFAFMLGDKLSMINFRY